MKKFEKGFSQVFIIIIIALVTAGAVGSGVWYWQQKNIKKFEESYKKPAPAKPTSTPTSTPKSSPTPTTTPDETADWLTYTNTDVGYTLKYPPAWTIEETSAVSEITGELVKYIIIHTPDSKYFLYFGLKGTGDTYRISDRTGIGAGDWVADGTITILETPTTITQLAFEGKVKELFYPQSAGTTSSGTHQYWASFSSGDGVDYTTLDMTAVDEATTAETILKTVSLL